MPMFSSASGQKRTPISNKTSAATGSRAVVSSTSNKNFNNLIIEVKMA